jgi:diguanylate cyclase (GGDEF)-like protein
LILERGKAKLARFSLALTGETDCAVAPADLLAALGRWRPDLVTVAGADFAADLVAQAGSLGRDDPMLLLVPMPDPSRGQASTRIGIILDPRFDAHRPKAVIDAVLHASTLSQLTGLVSGWALEPYVNFKIARGEHFAFLHIDANDFKAYNDVRGLAQGDVAIKVLGEIVTAAVRDCGAPGDIAAHIGGDDFAVITGPERPRRVAAFILRGLRGHMASLYSAADIERGHMVANNRRGELQRYPLMTLAIAAVKTTVRPVKDYRELMQIISMLKEHAKRPPTRSRYVEERRRKAAG